MDMQIYMATGLVLLQSISPIKILLSWDVNPAVVGNSPEGVVRVEQPK